MKNIYQQQLIDFCMKQRNNNLHNSQKIYLNNYVHKSEIINGTGFLRINIINQIGGTPVANATITIYVTDGIQRDIPIMHLITTINPIRIELPIAYELGTQLVGSEYNFSTYNLRVDAFGYFANEVYNIRLFPNITTDLEIVMIPISQVEMTPGIEERTDIPPHPRDVLN